MKYRQFRYLTSSYSKAPATWLVLLGNLIAIITLSTALFGPIEPNHTAIVFKLAPSFQLTRIKTSTPPDGPTVLFGLNGFCQRPNNTEDWDCQKQLNMRQPYENRNFYNVTNRPFHVVTPAPAAFVWMVYISWSMMWLHLPLAYCSRLGATEGPRISRRFHKWIFMWGFAAASLGLQGYLAMYLWWNKVQDDITKFIFRWVALDANSTTPRRLPDDFNVVPTVEDAFVLAWIGYGFFIIAVGTSAAKMPEARPILETDEVEQDIFERMEKVQEAIQALNPP